MDVAEAVAEVDRRRAAAVRMLDQVTDSQGVCAITKSGRSFPAAKVYEGAVAALGEVRRSLLRSTGPAESVVAEVRRQWEERARESSARTGPDWEAYHHGGWDALASLEELLGR